MLSRSQYFLATRPGQYEQVEFIKVKVYGWRIGAKFTQFIFIHIQCSYINCYSRIYLSTFNNRICIQEMHLLVQFLFTITFAHIYEMSSFTSNVLYSFTFTIEIFIQHFLRTTFAHQYFLFSYLFFPCYIAFQKRLIIGIARTCNTYTQPQNKG